MTFKDQQYNSKTFQAWKMKFLNSMTIQVFNDPYVPFYRLNICKPGLDSVSPSWFTQPMTLAVSQALSN